MVSPKLHSKERITDSHQGPALNQGTASWPRLKVEVTSPKALAPTQSFFINVLTLWPQFLHQ